MAAARETRFADLLGEVGDAMRRFVVRRAPASMVDDVVADTFLVLWRRLDDVPEDDPLPWCYAVARGCLSNALRTTSRQRRLTERIAGLRPDRAALDPAGVADGDPGLAAALASLGPHDAELLRLSAWEDLRPAEIAVVLGISANAVSVRLHRARRRLATALDAERQAGTGRVTGPRVDRTETGDGRERT